MNEHSPSFGQRCVLLALSIAGGVLVFLTASELFPYLSVNHDEAVYLQQAAMLLDGKFWLSTPVPGAFRPWFFVLDGSRLYPKYTPMTALLFAPGVAVGQPRLVLAVIGAGIVWLVGAVTAEAFDWTTGLVAAAVTLVTPFFLFISASFLSYAPTTLLTVTFALAYVRSFRRGIAYAPVAGVAIGLAFFARPYTAVVFAVPFVCHAVVVLVGGVTRRAPLERIAHLGVIAIGGLAGVGLTLWYNSVVTHDPFTFPYAVFAPQDGLGFGRRSLLGYSIDYTPALAVRVTVQTVAELVTRWSAAGPVGAILAAIGAYSRTLGERDGESRDLSDRTIQRLLLGVGASVVVFEGYFWGTRNALGTIGNPLDGFSSRFGPFYHFDLLLVLSAFGAAGIVWIVRTVRPRITAQYGPAQCRAIGLAVLLVAAPVAGSVGGAHYDRVYHSHMNTTDDRAVLNEPFERRTLDDAVVFMPTVQGPWLSHPFESQRNGGSLSDGSVLFAQRRGPRMTFDVIDSFPNRTPYRYTFQGTWPSNVTPVLRPLSVHSAEAVEVTTTVSVHGRLSSVELAFRQGNVYRAFPVANQSSKDSVSVTYRVTRRSISLVSIGGRPVEPNGPTSPTRPTNGLVVSPDRHAGSGQTSYRLTDGTRIVLTIGTVRPSGRRVTYHQWLGVDEEPSGVRFVWPGTQRVCLNERYCGRNGTYLNRTADAFPDDVGIDTTWERTTVRHPETVNGVALRDRR